MLEIFRRSLLRTPLRTSAACICAALALGSADAASAVAGPTYEPEVVQSSRSAIWHWRADNPWRYGTDGIFSLTRGLADEPIHIAGWVAASFVTVPLDLIQLPFAALGGLWGD